MKAKSRRTASIAAPRRYFRLIFHFCFVLTVSSVVSGEDLRCPPGWIALGGGDCFLVSEHLSTWLLARAFCLEQGADLVALSNASDEALIADYINASSGQVEGLWLGLNDLNLPTVFEWSDSSPLTYTKWSQDAPNWNAVNATGNCVSLNHEMQWEIENCTTEFGFICRMRNDSRVSVLKKNSFCHSGMQWFRDSCYWTVSGDSWASADQWCKSEGGHLVTIEDSLENMFVYTTLVQLEHKVHWLGLKVTEDSQRLAWVTGENVQYSNWNYSPEISSGECGVMVRYGKWMLQPCNFQYAAAVCEKTMTAPLPTTPAPITLSPPEECPAGWSFFKDGCYLVQKNGLFTWEHAREECMVMGGDLAHFLSKEDEETLMTSLLLPTDEAKSDAIFDASSSPGVWIGLQIKVLPPPETGPRTTIVALSWTDGTTPVYHNWRTGPNTTASDLCVLLPVNTVHPQWTEKPCSTKAGYVCRKAAFLRHGVAIENCLVIPCVPSTAPSDPDGVPPPSSTAPPTSTITTLSSTTTTTTPTTTTTSASTMDQQECPADWDVYGSKCFSCFSQPTEWKSAQETCRKMGTNYDLPSIHSPGEQAFLTALLTKYQLQEAWIGLNDLTTKGRFEWSDGTLLDFTRWSRDETLDQSLNPERQQDQDCVVMTDLSNNFEKWDVKVCHYVTGFFCQLTLENEDAIEVMAGRPPIQEWNPPPPIDSQEPSSTTTPNPWHDAPPVQDTRQDNAQANPNVDPIDAEVTETSSTLDPFTRDFNGQEPDIPVLSDLPASQSAILDAFGQPLSTSTAEPWWMDDHSEDMTLTKCSTQDYRPLTSGTIAGIVLGCLLGSGIIASVLIYLYHRHINGSVISREKLSFDNALYNPSADQIQLNTNEVTSTTPA